MKYLLSLFLFSVGGCSSTHQIAQSSTRIGALAQNSKGRFEYIAGEARSESPNVPGIAESAEGGIVEQNTIIEEITKVVHSLPGIQDVSPWWAELITYGLILGTLVATLILLWRLGLDRLIRGWLGWATPTAKAEATLAAELVSSTDDPRVLRTIQRRRDASKDFDRAFREKAPQKKTRHIPRKRKKT